MPRYLLLEDGGKILLDDYDDGSALLLEGAAGWQLRRRGKPSCKPRITDVEGEERITAPKGEE